MSIFHSFTPYILNPTHTFRNTSVKHDNKKEAKTNKENKGILLVIENNCIAIVNKKRHNYSKVCTLNSTYFISIILIIALTSL